MSTDPTELPTEHVSAIASLMATRRRAPPVVDRAAAGMTVQAVVLMLEGRRQPQMAKEGL